MRRTGGFAVAAALVVGCFNPGSSDTRDETTTTSTGDAPTTAGPTAPTTDEPPTTTGECTTDCGTGPTPTTTSTTTTTTTLTTSDSGETTEQPPAPPEFMQMTPIDAPGASALVAGLLNDDTIPDLAVTSSSDSTLYWLLGGTTQPMPYPASASVAMVGLNFGPPDMDIDLVLAPVDSMLLETYSSMGEAPVAGSPIMTPCPPLSLATGQVTGDANPDVVVMCSGVFSAYIFKGDVGGVFDNGTAMPIGQMPTAIAVGDVVGTPDDDLIVVSSPDNFVDVYRGLGDGLDNSADSMVFAAPYELAIGDLDGAAPYDLVVLRTPAIPGGPACAVLRGGPVLEPLTPFDCGGETVTALALGDLDGDALSDLVTLETSPDKAGKINIYLYAATQAEFVPIHAWEIGMNPQRVVIADLDGDEDGDIAVTSAAGIELFFNAA